MRQFFARYHLVVWIAVGVAIANGCGGGCGGCGGGNYTYPENRVQERIFKTRITRAGIDFLRARIRDLLQLVLGVDQFGRITVPIPSSTTPIAGLGDPGDFLNTQIYLHDDPNTAAVGDAGSISIDFSSLDVDIVEGTPPKLTLSIRDALVDVNLRILADLEATLFGGDAVCYVRGGSDRGTPQQRALRFDMDLEATLEIDADSNLQTTVTVPNFTTRDLDLQIDAAPRSDPECADGIFDSECDTTCGATDFLASAVEVLRSFLSGFIDNQLRSLIQSQVESLLDGQPLKFEGEIPLADLLGSLLPNAQPLGLLLEPDSSGFTFEGTGEARGLNLDMRGGAESSPSHPCVPALDPLPTFTPGPFPTLTGRDSQSRVYHVGLTLSDAFLNQFGLAAYTSGSLCLSISSQTIYEATGGSFSLDAGTLALLVPGLRDYVGTLSPVLIQISPTKPPSFKLGSGELVGETRDSLIQVRLEGMTIGMYALIDDRMTRLFQFGVDINLGLSLEILPDQRLFITIDNVAIGKISQLYNEIFQGTDVESALGFLVDLATNALLGQGLDFAFDVTDALPDPLRGTIGLMINEIKRDGPNDDYLTLALTLLDLTGARPARFHAETEAAIASAYPAMTEDLRGRRKATGRLGIDVGGLGLGGSDQDLEYQTRLDNGLWSSFRSGPRLMLETPRLLLIGNHWVEVRARVRGMPTTLDPTPVRIDFVVDPIPPRLWLDKEQDVVWLTGEDELTPAGRLAYSWRLDRGSWSPFAVADRISLNALPPGELLQVRVRDEAGNVSNPVSIRVARSHGRTTSSNDGCGSSGCGSAGSFGGGGWFFLLVALGIALRGRRRLRVFFSLALALGGIALVPGCGDSTGCSKNADCPTGFRCKDQQCAPRGRCDNPANPDPCCPGQVCSSAGICVDVIPRCNPDGTCDAAGQTCSQSGDGGSSADGICSYPTCTNDSQCSGGASCFNGFCRTPTPCGGGCPQGEVCITPTDECYPAPTGCATQSCGAGQILVFEDIATQIGATCDLAIARCVCSDIPQIPPGDWGRDSQVVVLPGGQPVVSAYDKTYGDVVLARFDASGTLQKLEYVDGVPTGATPIGPTSGRRGGIAEAGPDVGRYTSVAVDASQNPILAYYDVDNADLKFAAWDASGSRWVAHTVDATGDVGRYAHLAVGPGNLPAIAYLQLDGGGGGTRMVGLKYARAKTANPRTASDWEVGVVELVAAPMAPSQPCAGACTGSQVCVTGLGGADDSCETADNPPGCMPACTPSQACVNSVCRDKVAPPPAFDDLPEALGLFPSLAFSAGGIPHIAYYDRIQGNLKGARAASGTPTGPSDWQTAVVDGTEATHGEGDVGLFPSLAFTPSGSMAIAYEDATHDHLVLYLGSEFTGGTREVVDSGTSAAGTSLVGADASLAVAPDGTIFVAYQDATLNDLRLARRTGANQWSLSTVLSDGAWGFFADLAIAGGNLYISNVRFGTDLNAQPNNELRLVVQPLP